MSVLNVDVVLEGGTCHCTRRTFLVRIETHVIRMSIVLSFVCVCVCVCLCVCVCVCCVFVCV